MIDYSLYYSVALVFVLNLVAVSKNPVRLTAIRTVLSYILLVRVILYDEMLSRSLSAVFHSVDLLVFSLSSIVLLLFFVILLYTFTASFSHYRITLMPLALMAGVLSTRITADIYLFFDRYTILSLQYMSQILQLRNNIPENMLTSSFSILIFSSFTGITEEFAKFILFFAVIYFICPERDKFNIIFYLSCIALGFSLVENIYYSLEFGHYIRIMRNIFAGHLIFALYMGYLIYRTEAVFKAPGKIVRILICLFIPALLHTLWNFFSFLSLFSSYAGIAFYLYYILLVAGLFYLFLIRKN